MGEEGETRWVVCVGGTGDGGGGEGGEGGGGVEGG